MSYTALIGGFLAGLLGGAHCIAMCGGFVAVLSGSGVPARAQGAPLLPAREIARRQLAHNVGRIATYAALGAVAGAAGGFALDAGAWMAVQRALFVLANLLLLALAAAIATGREGAAWLQRAGAVVFGRAMVAARPLLARPGTAARLAVGAAWGLVPCGLVYSVLAVALFAGGALEGAAVMLAFGLGTLPNLLAAGWLVARARSWLDSRFARFGAALLLAGFAAVGLWRALLGPMSRSQGAFCF